MSATQIYIASAGSGKTFTLVREYLKIVFSQAHIGNYVSFKNILAITFTNKATLEMKQRIIHELKQIATNGNSDQLKGLQEEFPYISNFDVLANHILIKLLHDYSNFNIQTIDSFFQNIIKVFARELDLPMNYEVIIDNKEGIDYAVDELMAQIGQDQTLTDWLEGYAFTQLDNDKSWDFRSLLKTLSKEIFGKEGNFTGDELRIEQFKNIKEKLRNTITSFETDIKTLAKKAITCMESVSMPNKALNAHFLSVLSKLANGEKGKTYDGNQTFLNAIKGETDPIKTTTSKKYSAEIIALANTNFSEYLTAIHLLLEEKYPVYLAHKEVFKNIYALAVISKLNTYLKDYKAQENALFLIDAAKLIKGFISIDDTPFLFEKLANRIHYLFIDEFQDTSILQWENLRPIIENILSSADKPLQILIVGDAKQSIYRFRGGDYQLLTHKAAKSLPNYIGTPINLNDNWRSLSSIVDFNNAFFTAAVEVATQSDDPNLHDEMKAAYQGLHQNCKQNSTAGKVSIAVLSNLENDWQIKSLAQLIIDIEELQNIGYALHQIAILVRKKEDGVKISQHLQTHGFEIVSQETLLLLHDNEVKLLLAAFTYLNQPNESLYYTNLVFHYSELKQKNLPKNDVFLDSHLRELLHLWCPDFEKRTSMGQSLLSILDSLIDLLDIDISKNLFVSHFKQIVNNFYKNQSTNLSDFLEWWEIEGPKKSIVVEDSKDKIKVMTIHKSKGLEFPVVLIPFCTWEFKSNLSKNYLWVSDSEIEEGVIFPIKAISDLERSIYREHYLTEIKLNWMDNVNQMYVAFTRAKEVLKITCKYENLRKEEPITVAQLIHRYFDKQGTSIAEEEDFLFESGTYEKLPIPILTPPDTTETLTIASDAKKYAVITLQDIFSNDVIRIGNLIHTALYYLSNDNPETSFLKASKNEIYSSSEIKLARTHFFNFISTDNQLGRWLEMAIQTWDEQPIYYEGKSYRLDKIIRLKDKYVIIDYKTGEFREEYYTKIKTYMAALKALGINELVEGYIFYTESGRMSQVN